MSNSLLIRFRTSISLVAVFVLSALMSCGGPLVPFDPEWYKAPREGLVGEWLLEGSVKDTSPSNAVILSQSGSFVTDRFGKSDAAYFVNSNSQTSFGSSNFQFTYTDNFSLSGWLFTNNSFFGSTRPIGISPFAGSGFEVVFEFNGSGDLAFLVGSYGNGNYGPASNIEISSWIHILMVYENGVVYGYKNGISIGAVSFKGQIGYPPSFAAFNVYFENAMGAPFVGNIDDVRVYNRALTEDEIQRLYHEKGYGY